MFCYCRLLLKFPRTPCAFIVTQLFKKNVKGLIVTDGDALKSTKSVSEKRLRLEVSSIKELVQTPKIEHVLWNNTKEQLADCLTKKGASPQQLLKALSEGHWKLDKNI